MADYGVIPQGFSAKPLAVILAELEAAHITEFGPDAIQTAASPLGQLNGVFAEGSAKAWELAQDIYQALDPDSAEGLRLDTLAKIRLLKRAIGESDESFRKAITNAGRANIDLQDIERALAAIDGVTYFEVWTRDVAPDLPPETPLCIAVTGGADEEIANAIRAYVVPGMTLFGNTVVESLVEGRCRSFPILRPINVPTSLEIEVVRSRDSQGCPPPSLTAIKAYVHENLFFMNGEDVTFYKIRQIIESGFPNVEVKTVRGERDSIISGANQPVVFGFIERAVISADSVLITDAP